MVAMLWDATEAPLLTCAPIDKVLQNGGILPVTQAGTKTKQVEDAFGLAAARYYYAGRVHPQFGDCAFAFDSSLEVNVDGDAHPFDTGGLYWGKMSPTRDLKEVEVVSEACRLAKLHRKQLSDWRDAFAEHLSKAFAGGNQYLRGIPTPGTLDETLPAMNTTNHDRKDWRSWTWEIRIHIPNSLDTTTRVACSPAAKEALLSYARGPNPRHDSLLRIAERDDLIVDMNFAEKLEEAIQW